MKPNKINLNINKDDHNLNDYLFIWSETGVRPSKTLIHGYFNKDKFSEFLEKSNITQITTFTDVIPTQDVSVINEKVFSSIEENIFLTYTFLDKNYEESIVAEVAIFYTTPNNQRVVEIVEQLKSFSIVETTEEENEVKPSKSNILSLSTNGFELDKVKVDRNFDDIEYYYENQVFKKIKKLSKKINNNDKGLSIMVGGRGCGKTTSISYIISKCTKTTIFIPCNLIDNTINNPDFRNFLKQNPNSILVIDDADLYFSQMYSKSTFFTNNLLQLIDGLYSDSLNLNIILSMNCELVEIDKTLLQSNNIIDIIEYSKLSSAKVEELCDFLGKKIKVKGEFKLVDVLKEQINNNIVTELGFK